MFLKFDKQECVDDEEGSEEVSGRLTESQSPVSCFCLLLVSPVIEAHSNCLDSGINIYHVLVFNLNST